MILTDLQYALFAVFFPLPYLLLRLQPNRLQKWSIALHSLVAAILGLSCSVGRPAPTLSHRL